MSLTPTGLALEVSLPTANTLTRSIILAHICRLGSRIYCQSLHSQPRKKLGTPTHTPKPSLHVHSLTSKSPLLLLSTARTIMLTFSFTFINFYCGPSQLARKHCSFFLLFYFFNNLTFASNRSNENKQKH